jgi:hypothetical protein
MAKSKVVFEFDPFDAAGMEPPSGKRDLKAALREIGEYVRDELLQYYGDGKSPAMSGEWKKKLTKEYKARKALESSSGFANMELSGDMLDALEFEVTSDGKIKIGWFDSEQAAKAEGHQTGYKGHPTITDGPRRQLLPEKGGSFRKDIVSGMKEIASEFMPDEE